MILTKEDIVVLWLAISIVITGGLLIIRFILSTVNWEEVFGRLLDKLVFYNASEYNIPLKVPSKLLGLISGDDESGSGLSNMDAIIQVPKYNIFRSNIPTMIHIKYSNEKIRAPLRTFLDYDSYTWNNFSESVKTKELYKLLISEIREVLDYAFQLILPAVIPESKLVLISNFVSQLTGEQITPHIIKLIMVGIYGKPQEDINVWIDDSKASGYVAELDRRPINVFDSNAAISDTAVSEIIRSII